MKRAGREFGWDSTTQKIIQCILKVHSVLGPGFLESIYRNALTLELRASGMAAETEAEVKIMYEGQLVGRHRLDILVENKVVVELKTVEKLGRIHYAQVRSYLKATNLNVAILADFAKESADFRRIERT